jgi:hypothetical protein
MIVWDASDGWAPCVRHGKCAMCRGRLRFPFVIWWPDNPKKDDDDADSTRFICDGCCDSMCRGFSVDMRQISTAKKVERLGFDRAGRQAAVSGGFLYAGADNKQ